LYCFADSLAIRDLTVEIISDVSVTVRWRKPQAFALILNKILVTVIANEHNVTLPYPADKETVIIDLVPSFLYNISVVAVYNSSNITSTPTTVKIKIPDCQGIGFSYVW